MVVTLPTVPLQDEDCYSHGLIKYYNEEQVAQCPDDFFGDPVTIPAGTLYSCVSLADANQQAAELAQSQLQCQPEWKNVEQSAQCDVGYSGSAVTVPAGSFSSTISQSDADQQALAYAESQLVCELIPQTPMPRPCAFLYTSTDHFFVFAAGDRTIYEVGRSGYHVVFASGYDVIDMMEGSDGNYYFTSYTTAPDTGCVYKLTPDGVVTLLASGLGHCKGICEGPDGALYTSPTSYNTSDEKAWRITKSGATSVYATPLTGRCEYIGLSEGKFYVSSQYYAGGSIFVLSGPGSFVEWPLGGDAAGLRNLAISNDGYIYVVAEQNGKVSRVSRATGVLEVIATVPLNHPYGIAFIIEDSNGVLYVVTTLNNPSSRVFKVTKTGVVTLLGTISTESVYGVALGFDGDIFIGGYVAADAVYRVNHITGEITAFA